MYDKYGYKNKFLAEPGRNTKDITNAFNHIAFFEEFIKKDDLCKFTLEEFSALIQSIISKRKRAIGTVEKDVSYMRSYLDSCADNAVLTNLDIQNMLDKKNLKVKGWLNTLSGDISDTQMYLSDIEMFSLESMAKNNEISFQAVAAVWLLFLGLNLEEVLHLKEADIRNWNNWCRNVSEIPNEIIDKVNFIIESALNEKGSPKLGKYNNAVELPYKKSKYFLKSTQFEDKPIVDDTLSHNFDKIRDKYGKSKMRQLNIRKSGMLFFGARLLKEHRIKNYEDLKSLIYRPLYRRFDVPETYKSQLDDIFRNDTINNALESFYGVVVPELDRVRKFMGRKEQATNPVRQRSPRKPKERTNNGDSHWERNADQGDKGELRVLEWIRRNYQVGENEAYRVQDVCGYDIFVQSGLDTKYIEVKTMRNKACSVNITAHEYFVAHRKMFKDNYWFYILVWDQEDKSKTTIPQLYIFKDFLGLLNLRNKRQEIFKCQTLNNVSYKSFSVRLDQSILDKCDGMYQLMDVI